MMPARKYLKVSLHILTFLGEEVSGLPIMSSPPADGYTTITFNPEQIINTILWREITKVCSSL